MSGSISIAAISGIRASEPPELQKSLESMASRVQVEPVADVGKAALHLIQAVTASTDPEIGNAVNVTM
ncbi:MAG TPA: hypothetical protein PKY35_10885 [Candidatus Hydrogenedentes bacterium]|nr:hypothetical protein [Candidatus Hydrogenedentota bacterium]HOL77528.1 hypothetical protein [Candidatus Hydrogenedentota bacterium]HPO86593.1 hypothetical protein [Candidatus Hydrogenedentota bacterium]